MLVDDLESNFSIVFSSLSFPEPRPDPEGPRAEHIGEGAAAEAVEDVKVGERAGAQAVLFFLVLFGREGWARVRASFSPVCSILLNSFARKSEGEKEEVGTASSLPGHRGEVRRRRRERRKDDEPGAAIGAKGGARSLLLLLARRR